MGKTHTNPKHNHLPPAFGQQMRVISLMASDPGFHELAHVLHSEYEAGTQPRVVTQDNDTSLEKENELLRSQVRLLKWMLLGFGVDYPPDSWTSFDDFTDLSKN